MPVEPSSLIFLVIIGIWAAYFVQYWVRRREHLATIRSVDAFSETMRVLQRRVPLPAVDAETQAPRTYAVSPARAMRPQVTVKRAEAFAAQRDRATASASTAATSVAAPATTSRPDTSFAAELESEGATMSPSRTTRGIVLLVGLLGTVAFSLLAAFGVLVVWSPVVPLLMAGAGFAWLRAGVQGEIRARRRAQQRTHRSAVGAGSRPVARPARPATAVAGRAVEQVEQVEQVAVAQAEQAEHETEREIVAEAPAEMPFDVSAQASPQAPAEPEVAPPAAETVVEQPVANHVVGLPEVDEDDIPLTWDPRPVPRPTYTMKARAAERPAPAPEVETAAEAEHTAYDDVPERRIVGG